MFECVCHLSFYGCIEYCVDLLSLEAIPKTKL